ncbi:transcriptional regulator [Nitrosomonas ureae]|uniref:Helix-turn-helix n=1 Tax=Nitrosomonas ureae TaxID=44577 RepID=A0A1H9HA87_9PROT|nr:transcriptional regulator [Nitrosomonas ureae]SEQ59245.1 hypothetical protein SAMN05421510_10962 [Nitrosomonas ureae]SOD17754.1 hypothetical protein SAMN06297164_1334 [Nitrosomonas ureae]
MTLQKIKSVQGKDEYVLLPIAVYHTLKDQIEKELAVFKADQNTEQAYVPFALEDYVDNPMALARTKADITQEQRTQRMGVSQAYVSQIECRSNKLIKCLNV